MIVSQMLSIVLKMVLIGFIALRFKGMKYSFWYIFIRYIIYRDNKPIRWLTNHIIFIYYLGLEFTQCIILIGLLHQLRIGRLSERLPEFAFASPLSSLFLSLIFYNLFSAIDTNKAISNIVQKFKFNKKQKLKNNG